MLTFFSPNFSERKRDISFIVLHFSHCSYKRLKGKFMDPSKEVSSHYSIKRNGQIVKFVDEDKRAWHAGDSFWKGHNDVNSASIGIELINDGIGTYTEKQIDALIVLLKDVMNRHKIKPENVLGHSDVATSRKVDPGNLFPWDKLIDNGLSVGFDQVFGWNSKCKKMSEKFFYKKCDLYGYDIRDKVSLERAVQLRFPNYTHLFPTITN